MSSKCYYNSRTVSFFATLNKDGYDKNDELSPIEKRRRYYAKNTVA